MIGGINDAHCEQDIIDAIALGADAFALNLAVTLDSSHSWALNAVDSLFKHAQTHNFKLLYLSPFPQKKTSAHSYLVSLSI